MQIRSRAIVLAVLGVGPLLLAAGCGGATASGPTATLAKIQPTSFVEVAPATTTTTSTIPIDPTGTISSVEQIYKVQPNDGPARIAALFEITQEQLFNYNQWPEGTSHVFLVGEEVRIPPGTPILGAGSQTTDTGSGTDAGTGTDDGGGTDDTAPSGDCPTTYVIKSGDNTRIGVAERFGITYQQMDAANVNTPGYSSFVVGTSITIPCP